jgi:hypothetical protein
VKIFWQRMAPPHNGKGENGLMGADGYSAAAPASAAIENFDGKPDNNGDE